MRGEGRGLEERGWGERRDEGMRGEGMGWGGGG